MTYNMFGGTLSLTQSINQSHNANRRCLCLLGHVACLPPSVLSSAALSISRAAMALSRGCPRTTCLHQILIFCGKGLNSSPHSTPFNTLNSQITPHIHAYEQGRNQDFTLRGGGGHRS